MSIKRIKNLVKQLNEYRHAYYNQDAPLVSDAEYDRLFDELKELEEQTGFILSNSPTQTVGYYPVSELAKVTHPTPLLSLEKTKLISELLDFMKGQEVLFMLKLDGLTTKLIYEDGKLIQASTRGDGEVGEDITHNIPAFLNVPLTIPHKERLVITGESFIPTNDFERLKDTLRDGNGKPYKNGRNFASGSVRKENKFTGCTIVATGKLEHFTRDGINDKILELGAKPGSSVTKKTDYLICGEKAGSKLAKAQSLGIPILTEAEFLEMIA